MTNTEKLLQIFENCTGQEVFEALKEGPTENLLDMHDMIKHILEERYKIEE